MKTFTVKPSYHLFYPFYCCVVAQQLSCCVLYVGAMVMICTVYSVLYEASETSQLPPVSTHFIELLKH